MFDSRTRIQTISYLTLDATNYQMLNSNQISTLAAYSMNQTSNKPDSVFR